MHEIDKNFCSGAKNRILELFNQCCEQMQDTKALEESESSCSIKTLESALRPIDEEEEYENKLNIRLVLMELCFAYDTMNNRVLLAKL